MSRPSALELCSPVSADAASSRLMDGTDRFGRPWKGRAVAVVGLGRSGLAAAELLCRLGCRVRATDASETDHQRAVKAMLSARGAEEIELGHHSQKLIARSELVVVSPGVAESAAPIQWAREQGLPVLSEIELAYHFCPSPIVAVTGTNGKSTVVTLIAELLRTANRPAIACGNLGIPFSSVVGQLTPQSVAVVEVSSFQLLGCDQFRPRIGVLLNLGMNHLDRHHDRQAYAAAKARLFQRQTPEDWAVLNGRDPHVVSLSEGMHAQQVWFGENRSNSPRFQLAPQTRRALTESAQAILQVVRLFNIPDPLAWQVLRSSQGLEHRLEYVATIHGVHFINDSKSTTPDSCLYALAQTRGSLVVILGGRDKGLEFGPLSNALGDARVKGVVLIGESRRQLRQQFNGHTTVLENDTLEGAVETAAGLAEQGTSVLFSPACASFDMFRDFEERGRVFKHIVQCLENGAGGRGRDESR